MRVIGNFLWLLLGGLEMTLAYAFFGLFSFVFIITIPFGIAAFRLAGFALWPFGRVLVEKPTAGAGSVLANIVWILIAGIWLAIGHLLAAALNAITIIGIPFAVAHMKLAGAALTPFGHEVMPIGQVSGRRVDVGIKPLG